MFQISIRELLLIVLLAAIALGWYVHSYQLSVELQEARRWRNRAGALEQALKDDDWDVIWYLSENQVVVRTRGDRRWPRFSQRTFHTDVCPPAAQ